MNFIFDYSPSDSPFIETIWRTRSDGGSMISAATTNWEMVITKQKETLTFGLRGPETKATPAPIPDDAEIIGITFKLGTFMPQLPTSKLVDRGITLPQATGQRYWLHGETWQVPDFDNADLFVERLVRYGVLVYDPIIEAALQGSPREISERSIQRRFRRATGLTHGTLYQIKRAHHALSLLQQGASILDTVEQAGYYDQPHLTRSLKRLMGQTPAEILRGYEQERGIVQGK